MIHKRLTLTLGFLLGWTLGHVAQGAQPELLPAPRECKPEAPYLPGFYSVAGAVGEKDYAGVCMIQRVAAGYIFRWVTDSGAAASVGMRGSEGEVVVGGASGVVRFKVELDGVGKPRLVGQWTDSSGNVGTEVLTWLRDR